MNLEQETRDELTELIGLGIGKAAEVLNTMLDSHIALCAPSIRIVSAPELIGFLAATDGAELSAVQMRYSGSMAGTVELIFSSGEGGRLVDCIMGDDPMVEEGLDAIRAGTLCEVGNIVINALMGTLANVLSLRLEYTVPAYIEGDAARLVTSAGLQAENVVLLAETEFLVEKKSIRGTIAVFFTMDSFAHLRDAMRSYAERDA
jgi:chemotaxis protein CheC